MQNKKLAHTIFNFLKTKPGKYIGRSGLVDYVSEVLFLNSKDVDDIVKVFELDGIIKLENFGKISIVKFLSDVLDKKEIDEPKIETIDADEEPKKKTKKIKFDEEI